jgi:hypothetical protein
MKKVESEDVTNQDKTLSGNAKKYKEQSPAERLLGDWSTAGRKKQKKTRSASSCFCFARQDRSLK